MLQGISLFRGSLCAYMRARAFARTRPDISSPLIYGGMEMGGCAIGRAYMRMRMRMRMRERRERGRMDGGREGRFYLLQGISTATTTRRPRGLLSLSPRYLLFAARNKPIPLPAFSYAYAPARLRTHIFPPPIYGGENGHIGACARACMRMRMRMRMREGGCLSCCGLYAPPQPPAPPRCPIDVVKCKIFDLRGFLFAAVKYTTHYPKTRERAKEWANKGNYLRIS